MASPSYNFLNGTGHRPFNTTVIGIGVDPFPSAATLANLLARSIIHTRYNNANKSWVDLDAVRDDKPNLGFIRPLFSITVEHSAPAGGGGGSATRNLKIGSTTVAGIYLGSSQFTHVYIGSTLIWSQS